MASFKGCTVPAAGHQATGWLCLVWQLACMSKLCAPCAECLQQTSASPVTVQHPSPLSWHPGQQLRDQHKLPGFAAACLIRPLLQAFLTKLLTVDLPSLMVLPKRLEINIPPAITSVAEAAVGHDVVMRAVASAVLQASHCLQDCGCRL